MTCRTGRNFGLMPTLRPWTNMSAWLSDSRTGTKPALTSPSSPGQDEGPEPGGILNVRQVHRRSAEGEDAAILDSRPAGRR